MGEAAERAPSPAPFRKAFARLQLLPSLVPGGGSADPPGRAGTTRPCTGQGGTQGDPLTDPQRAWPWAGGRERGRSPGLGPGEPLALRWSEAWRHGNT